MNISIVVLNRGTFDPDYMNLLSQQGRQKPDSAETLLMRQLRRTEKIVSLQTLPLSWVQSAEIAGWVDPEAIDLGVPFGGVQAENLRQYVLTQQPVFENITFLLTRREAKRLLPTFFSLHRVNKCSIAFYRLGVAPEGTNSKSLSASLD